MQKTLIKGEGRMKGNEAQHDWKQENCKQWFDDQVKVDWEWVWNDI